MRIINNLKHNHWGEMARLSKKSDELLLVSPFLTDDFSEFFSDIIQNSNIKSITLITTLPNDYKEILNKAVSLPSFTDCCDKSKVSYKIYIDNLLHGKLYIFSLQGLPVGGIITSANMTNRGMRINHEWGVQINNKEMLAHYKEEVLDYDNLYEIKEDEILKLMLRADEYMKDNPETGKTNPKFDLAGILHKELDDPETDIRYFLKPIGSTENPFVEHKIYNKELHFSKRYPRAVRVSDILICYSVGTTKLLGYNRVLSLPIHTGNKDDRWPWYVQTEYLSEGYSKQWWSYDTRIIDLCSDFIKKNPKASATYQGGKTLGALNFGADKIQLSTEFANFLISIIDNAY